MKNALAVLGTILRQSQEKLKKVFSMVRFGIYQPTPIFLLMSCYQFLVWKYLSVKSLYHAIFECTKSSVIIILQHNLTEYYPDNR